MFPSLLETATLLGHYRHLELALGALTGSRAASAGALGPFLSGAAGAHGWRAELFEARLPVSAGLPDAASLTVPASAEVVELVQVLETEPAAPLVAALVDHLYPAILAAWGSHARAASPVADGPVLRCLRRAGADLAAVREEGLASLERVGRPEVPSPLAERLAQFRPFGRGTPALFSGDHA